MFNIRPLNVCALNLGCTKSLQSNFVVGSFAFSGSVEPSISAVLNADFRVQFNAGFMPVYRHAVESEHRLKLNLCGGIRGCWIESFRFEPHVSGIVIRNIEPLTVAYVLSVDRVAHVRAVDRVAYVMEEV